MTETSELTALDADWAIPCEVPRQPAAVAEWIVHLGTCCDASRSTRLWCSVHLDTFLERPGPLTCNHCGRVMPAAKDAVRRFEPLNRKEAP